MSENDDPKDLFDNDIAGLTDCEGPIECHEIYYDDGFDIDGDGLTDCDDVSCSLDARCEQFTTRYNAVVGPPCSTDSNIECTCDTLNGQTLPKTCKLDNNILLN